MEFTLTELRKIKRNLTRQNMENLAIEFGYSFSYVRQHFSGHGKNEELLVRASEIAYENAQRAKAAKEKIKKL